MLEFSSLEFLKNFSFLENTFYSWLIAIIIFVGLIFLLKLFQVIILSRLKKIAGKTKNDLDDAMIAIFSKIKPPFYFFVALYFAIKYLSFPELVGKVLTVIILIAVVYEVVQAVTRFVDYFISKYLEKNKDSQGEKKHSQSMLRAASMIVKFVLWAIALIMILSNLGINVTSLIASLGIGGIAIALALQNILTDIFSSFSLYVDKPFQPGDFITVGTDSGTVERIGMKTTRIRTMQGEELVVSNRELTTARVQNFKKLEQRRVVTSLGVVYGLSFTKLKSIPRIIKKIVKEIEGVEFDRCHFANYGDFSLNFELVYFVKSTEYADYMDKNQEINLQIFKAFEQEKIEFAYPTQTIQVEKT